MQRIVLIDDHHIVREGFKYLLENHDSLSVIGEAATPEEGVRVCQTLQPDLVMLDLSLGNSSSGLDLIPKLLTVCPECRIAIVSMHNDPALVSRAFSQGAWGFISKAESPASLVNDLQRIAAGERVEPNGATDTPTRRVELSERELVIVKGIIDEKAPKVIAYDLGISDKTVYRQRANLFEKLGIRTTTDLKRIAQENGWLLQ